MNPFTHTRAALLIFDAGKPARTAAWECASTGAEIEDASDADYKALCAVQEAFWQDTKDINTRKHCALVDVDFIRRMVAHADKMNTPSQAQQWQDESTARLKARSDVRTAIDKIEVGALKPKS